MRSLTNERDHLCLKIIRSLLLTSVLAFLFFSTSLTLAEEVSKDVAPVTPPPAASQPDQSGKIASPGQAIDLTKTPNTIASMHLSIWPEYDDPRVLIMIGGDFEDKIGYPRKFNFLAPKDADINSTCSLTPEGSHLSQLYSVNKLENGQEISFNMPEPRFHYEYYYNPFNPLSEKDEKSFEFSFEVPYPTKTLAVEIQQPLKASNFSINPHSQNVSTDQKGLKYYHYEYTNLQPGQLIPFKMAYIKTDPAPSVKKEKYNPAQANFGSQTGNRGIIIALSVAMAVVLALGGYWIISSKKPVPQSAMTTTQRSNSRRFEKRGHGKGHDGVPGDTKFCTECGNRLTPGSKFCSSCGTRVKH